MSIPELSPASPTLGLQTKCDGFVLRSTTKSILWRLLQGVFATSTIIAVVYFFSYAISLNPTVRLFAMFIGCVGAILFVAIPTVVSLARSVRSTDGCTVVIDGSTIVVTRATTIHTLTNACVIRAEKRAIMPGSVAYIEWTIRSEDECVVIYRCVNTLVPDSVDRRLRDAFRHFSIDVAEDMSGHN